ncbi:MAG: FemAB family PEP-CTERM system-associated protein [Sphingomonadales bacterium]|nr:FemAB family PEP-CTERM system-associated protein [Sphingomonadales bacterium]MBD3774586.1 FemAB family PEP-CTERM system-associated protein [Paracoccaceae bacterium]
MNAPFPLCSEVISQVDLRDPGEVARIEGLVAAMPQGTAFHRPAWLRAVEQGAGQRAIGLIAEKGGAITGWLPLTEVHSPLFGRALVSSGFAVGGGALAEREVTARRLCGVAEEVAQRRSCASVELRGGYLPAHWQVIGGKHAGFSGPLAEDDEAQLNAIPRKQRAEVRKGLGNDLTVSVGREEADRAAHYACYAESVRNLGTPVFPRSLFDAVLDLFGEDADILTVRHGGTPVASVLSLYHKGVVLPYWGGGGWAARGLRASELMYYELMCHARRRGCEHFDFGRSKVDSGPYRFKKNWGFEPEPLTYATWAAPGSEARNIDPTDAGYSAKIEAWKRLPLALANRIGPHIARGLG